MTAHGTAEAAFETKNLATGKVVPGKGVAYVEKGRRQTITLLIRHNWRLQQFIHDFLTF